MKKGIIETVIIDRISIAQRKDKPKLSLLQLNSEEAKTDSKMPIEDKKNEDHKMIVDDKTDKDDTLLYLVRWYECPSENEISKPE